MVAVLIQAIIVLLVIGIIWWAVEQLLPMIPLPTLIHQIIRILIIVVLALVLIFYVLVPLLHQLGSAIH